MNRRTARLVLQAMGVAALFWPVVPGALPLWAQLAHLAFSGATGGELGVVARFGQGSLGRAS